MSDSSGHVAVVGLGYIGLPLAIEFGKRFPKAPEATNLRVWKL
jgi:UDP-N-acetyl-D-mannosaminuronate dehydrogenase